MPSRPTSRGSQRSGPRRTPAARRPAQRVVVPKIVVPVVPPPPMTMETAPVTEAQANRAMSQPVTPPPVQLVAGPKTTGAAASVSTPGFRRRIKRYNLLIGE